MCGYDLRKLLIFVVVILTLCLKAHNSNAAVIANRSLAFAKAQAMKQSGGEPGLSSYFERDLYGPNTYAFGFEVNDNRTGNVQFRDERRFVNGSVEGSFGHLRPDGQVMVTHFLSDNDRGFLHDTRTFQVGQRQQWVAHWPTKRPNLHMQRPQNIPTGTAIYDKDLHLNVTNSEMPADINKMIKTQYGIDLKGNASSPESNNNLVVQDIIDGKVPLQTIPGKTETHIGFDTVNDFLPPDFPIVPFKLPPMLAQAAEQGNSVQKPTNVEQSKVYKIQKQSKYNGAKRNNSEKSLSAEMVINDVDKTSGSKVKAPKVGNGITKSNQNKLNIVQQPSPLTKNQEDAASSNGAWYQQLIDQTRNDFLNK